MKKTALLALAFAVVSGPSMASARHHHIYRHRPEHHVYAYRHRSDHRAYVGRHRPEHRTDAYWHRPEHRTSARRLTDPAGAHAQITCGMVRAYVAQVGLAQARALALSAGMTAAQERRARRCLESGA
ncbi:MAG: hypothetical protein ACRECV_15405 [Xanthobacteraceae bacterium]